MSDRQPPNAGPPAIERERDHLRDGLAGLTRIISKYSDVVETDSSTRELRQIARSVAKDTEEMLRDARLLRLGVVGQVNAGKSSLLNLLLFNGQEVLPKAATPMTASLTHIVKSDRDEIEIKYYTPEDWKDICHHAREYKRAKKDGDTSIPDFVEAAAQLVEMAEEKRLNVHDHLGKQAVHEVPMAQLNDQLRRFVGSDGDLTPLVKSVTIRSSQGVPDLDIVDTPGINDPIASRSRQTDKMLSRCDAVLMLSYAGQFLTDSDVAFFKRRIPQEGIRHGLVLGSKFDSALVDEARAHRGLLDEAKATTERSLKARVEEALTRPEAPNNDGTRAEIILISAMCATLAQKPAGSWAPNERHAFDSLQRAYPDWLDQPEDEQGVNEATRDHLRCIGNRDAVDVCLRSVHANKDNIISEKTAAYLREKGTQALDELEELVKGLRQRKRAVETADVHEIESQRESLDGLQEELEIAVNDRWVDLIDEQKELMDELRDGVLEGRRGAREEIKGAVDTEMRTMRVTKGLGLVRFFTFGAYGYEDVPYEEKVLNRAELETAVNEFAEHVENELSEVVDKMFSRRFAEKASKRLRRAIVETVGDEWASEIKLTSINRSMREAVGRVVRESRESLKSGHDSLFDTEHQPRETDANALATSVFSALPLFGDLQNVGKVVGSKVDTSHDSLSHAKGFQYEGSSVEDGVAKGRQAVKQAADEVLKFLDSCKDQVDAVSDRAKADLVPATVAELERYQKRLTKEIASKEFTLSRYGLALDELARARRQLESPTDETEAS